MTTQGVVYTRSYLMNEQQLMQQSAQQPKIEIPFPFPPPELCIGTAWARQYENIPESIDDVTSLVLELVCIRKMVPEYISLGENIILFTLSLMVRTVSLGGELTSRKRWDKVISWGILFHKMNVFLYFPY